MAISIFERFKYKTSTVQLGTGNTGNQPTGNFVEKWETWNADLNINGNAFGKNFIFDPLEVVTASGTTTTNTVDSISFTGTALTLTQSNAPSLSATFSLLPSDIPQLEISKINNLQAELDSSSYTHPAKAWIDKTNLTGASVISNLIIDSLGHPTNWTTRTLTLGDLGYTGATDANNYIHPTYTAFNPTLSGAVVLASIVTDTIGSVTGITTRTLTPTNIGAEPAFSKGNIVVGNGVAATGTLTSRIIGTGDVNFSVDSTVVRTTGNQTIGGVKTFTDNVFGKNFIFDPLEVVTASGSTSVNTVDSISFTGTTLTLTQSNAPNLSAAFSLIASDIPQLEISKINDLQNQLNNSSYTHPSKSWIDKTNLTGATVISNLTIDSLGHPTNWTTRTLTASEIGAEPAFSKGNLTASTGISLTGTSTGRLINTGDLSITNTDRGSSQNIFKNINNGSGAWQFGAGSNNDSLSFAGSGATSVSFDAANKRITISSTDTNNVYTGGTGISLGGNSFNLEGQALALHNLNANGFIVRNGTNSVINRALGAGTGISITNSDGVSGNPSISLNLTYTDGRYAQSASLTNYVLKSGDVMSGNLGVGGTALTKLTAITNDGAGSVDSIGIAVRNLNTTSWTGVSFINSGGTVGGYLLLRNGANTGVYTSGGITLVADTGDLNLGTRSLTSSNINFYSGNGVKNMVLGSGGDLTVTGDIIAFSSSDERLKDNIALINDPLNKIEKIGGYSFDWNSKQKSHTGADYGVLAQEIAEILPEAVTTRDNGYLAVKYEKLIPLMIESIKKLNDKIKMLENK